MQIGMIGLGRMGSEMVRRLMRDGHERVVADRDAAAVDATVRELAPHLSTGDVIVDGGNSLSSRSRRAAEPLRARRVARNCRAPRSWGICTAAPPARVTS